MPRLDCSPDEIIARIQQREADRAWQESVRRQQRYLDLSPASRAKLAEWQARRDEAEHAEWLGSGEPDLLADMVAQRKAERVVAEAEWDVIGKTYRSVYMAPDSTDDQAEAATAAEESALAAWRKKYKHLFPRTKKMVPMTAQKTTEPNGPAMDNFAVAVRTGKIPTPTGSVRGVPLIGSQEVIVDLGRPIIEGFVACQNGKPTPDSPALPEAMRGHPLFELINTAIGHAIGTAERSPGGFRASAVTDSLAVLSLIHEDTLKTVVAKIRGLGCALPEGKLHTACKAFEAQVSRAVRSGAGWRTNIKGDPDPQNADNISVLLNLENVETRFNVWRQRIEVRWKGHTSEWVPLTDAELNSLRGIASREEYRFRPTKEFFRDMLADAARQTSFDPVLDWIDSALWDGIPRLSIWLSRACGLPCDLYHQAVGKNVIGGIVKRARNPGAKHDEVMILIGPQGCGKSNLTKALAGKPEWHTDSVTFEGRPQDIVPQLFGRLVIELSELDGVHRRDVGYIKRFLSTQTDNYTAKYEALSSDHARRCVFIGTCNLENPLVDDTGNRRFYPVRIPNGVQVDTAWLRENLSQLIGEAAHLESAGETFEIPRDVWASAAVAQDAARNVSAVEEMLLQWFTKAEVPSVAGYYVLSSDIVSALTMARQNANAKVGGTMGRLGYVQRRPYINGVQLRAWIKSVSGDIAGCVQLVPAQGPTGGPVEMRLRRGPL